MSERAHWTSPHGRELPRVGQRTLLMGILNVTPDSFSDGGKFTGQAQALWQVERMLSAGVDVVDIGGESTRPGATHVNTHEELARVLPVIEAIRSEFTRLPLSIDTYKADVARRAVEAGADMINDIWGARYGLEPAVQNAWLTAVEQGAATDALPVSPMARIAAELQCPIFLMHNRALPQYRDFWHDVLLDMRVCLGLARQAGVPDHQLWIDPGFGFGKTPPHNLEVLRGLDKLVALGYPVLLGTSRKSTIGLVLDQPVDKREGGTQTTHAWGIAKGCHMVRAHDVELARDTVRMADAIASGLTYGQKKEQD